MNGNNINWSLYKGSDSKRSKNAFIELMEMINNNGHTMLSEYSGSQEKILIDFNCGHEPHPISPANYKSGKGCPKCKIENLSKKRSEKSKEEFFKQLKIKGHVLLSNYTDCSNDVLIDFKCKHKPHWISPVNYKLGQGCPECGYESMVNKRFGGLSDEFDKIVKNNNHDIIVKYKNVKTKVLIDFKCHHDPSWVFPNDYKKNKMCPKCDAEKTKKIMLDNYSSSFSNILKENGHTMLSEYINDETKILIDFNCGHEPHPISPNKYKQGRRCPKCSCKCPVQAKNNFLKILEDNGHTLLSEYINNSTKVLIDFNCGHEPHPIQPNNYKSGKGCPRCTESKGEKIILDYLHELNFNTIPQYKIDGYSYEYDIYIPFYNLIVEVHGLQHYEEVEFFNKRTLSDEQENDKKKQELALCKGYNYMIIDYREHKPKLSLERFNKQFDKYLNNKQTA